MKITLRFCLLINALVASVAMAEMEPLNVAELASHVGGQVWQAEETAVKQRSFSVIDSGGQIVAPRLVSTQLNDQAARPSAGITMDINLQLYIEELRWTDPDGIGPNGRSGSVSLQGISVGHLDGLQPAAAIIKGVTVDVDGRDGLIIGVGQIGDHLGNGIDVQIESIQIGRQGVQLELIICIDIYVRQNPH